MVFSDQAFLFVFLPVALLFGILVRRTRYFPAVILIFSLSFFYWSSGSYVLLLLVSIAINYTGAIAVERWRVKRTLFVVVAVNVLLLVYYKYTDLLLGGLGYLGSPTLAAFSQSIVLPIGISFFTFQGISYVVDVWRREVPAERRRGRLALLQTGVDGRLPQWGRDQACY
jgi:alginate O-acetyltransferase complex protein AlgI